MFDLGCWLVGAQANRREIDGVTKGSWSWGKSKAFNGRCVVSKSSEVIANGPHIQNR